MDIISNTAHNVISGAALGASRAGHRQNPGLGNSPSSRQNSADISSRTDQQTRPDTIHSTASADNTLSHVFNPIDESQKSQANTFDLQQKNFAYLPINKASLSKTGTFVIEQKPSSPTDIFVQIANPPKDIRLIDTYI